MDCQTILLVLPFVWVCIHIFVSSNLIGRREGGTAARLPPGPYPLPVIGNILSLGKRPHESVFHLSKIYGPLMSLKLGTLTTVIVSSPNIAKEVLQKHDKVCSSRTISSSSRAHDHYKDSIAWLPVSGLWQNLRKICKEHMFSSQRLDANQGLRQAKVQQLVEYVQQSCENGQVMDIGKAAFTTTLNLISNTFFSVDLAHYEADSSQEFKQLVEGVLELSGKPNLADYFPILKSMDPQGIERQMTCYFDELFAIFDQIIEQRSKSRGSNYEDFLEVLLDFGKENGTQLNCKQIKDLLLDLFVAGTDTTASTVEWAMSELLHKPEKLAIAQAELRQILGKNGILQESDISRLPYLQAVVKETLRLHPPAPFLVPHKAEADVEIGGYMVPKNAQILVNVWAIGRDPTLWPDPNIFEPERFLDLGIDFKGQDFELIPFGAGRRICPGLPLAYRMAHFMLGSLLYSFGWKLEEGTRPEDMDMNDKFGLTLHKAKPLTAIPIHV